MDSTWVSTVVGNLLVVLSSWWFYLCLSCGCLVSVVCIFYIWFTILRVLEVRVLFSSYILGSDVYFFKERESVL